MGNLFEFELSPKLKGIYRRDYAKHSDFGVEEYNQIDAIVLTHAYVDHCAYIHYVTTTRYSHLQLLRKQD